MACVSPPKEKKARDGRHHLLCPKRFEIRILWHNVAPTCLVCMIVPSPFAPTPSTFSAPAVRLLLQFGPHADCRRHPEYYDHSEAVSLASNCCMTNPTLLPGLTKVKSTAMTKYSKERRPPSIIIKRNRSAHHDELTLHAPRSRVKNVTLELNPKSTYPLRLTGFTLDAAAFSKASMISLAFENDCSPSITSYPRALVVLSTCKYPVAVR